MPLQFPMTHDAMQSSLVFVQSQAARINAEVYRIQYRQVRYRGLVPVDTGRVSAKPAGSSRFAAKPRSSTM